MNEALRKVAESLEELSAAIKGLCSEPEVKPEEVRKVLAEMSKRGKTAEVKTLLEKYGASKLGLSSKLCMRFFLGHFRKTVRVSHIEVA